MSTIIFILLGKRKNPGGQTNRGKEEEMKG